MPCLSVCVWDKVTKTSQQKWQFSFLILQILFFFFVLLTDFLLCILCTVGVYSSLCSLFPLWRKLLCTNSCWTITFNVRSVFSSIIVWNLQFLHRFCKEIHDWDRQRFRQRKRQKNPPSTYTLVATYNSSVKKKNSWTWLQEQAIWRDKLTPKYFFYFVLAKHTCTQTHIFKMKKFFLVFFCISAENTQKSAGKKSTRYKGKFFFIFTTLRWGGKIISKVCKFVE